jgi:hypothetical protein
MGANPVSERIKAKDQSGSVQNRTPDTPLFRLGIQADHHAFAAPKVNGVINNNALRLLDLASQDSSAQRSRRKAATVRKVPTPSLTYFEQHEQY